MIDLIKLLPLMLRKSGDSEEVREHAVFAAWVGVVGHQLRQVSTPVKLERKTLLIAVMNSTWQTQLKKMSGQVLFQLNSLLGSPVVTTLEFVVNPHMIRSVPTPQSNQVPFIDPEVHAQSLEEQAKAISDPDLRNTFLRAASKCLDRRYR